MREVKGGIGYRVYQVRKEGNRHLIDIHPVSHLPPVKVIEGGQVVNLPYLIAGKVLAYVSRQGKPKAFTDLRELRSGGGLVSSCRGSPGPPVRDASVVVGGGAPVFTK